MENIYSIISIVAIILIILVIRGISTWYWKINERIELQKSSLEIQRLTLETVLKLFEQNGGDINWDEINKFLGKDE